MSGLSKAMVIAIFLCAQTSFGGEVEVLTARFYELASAMSEIVRPGGRVPIAIAFDNLISGQLATCSTYDDGRIININTRAWDAAEPMEREAILFHELGHCALNRAHDDSLVSLAGRTAPASLMNSFVVDSGTYQAHRDYYLRELFRPAFN